MQKGQCGTWPLEDSRGIITEVNSDCCILVIKDNVLSEEKKGGEQAATWHAKWKLSQELLHILVWGVFIMLPK